MLLIMFQTFYTLHDAFAKEVQFIFTFIAHAQKPIAPTFQEALKVIAILFLVALLFA